MIQLRSCQDTRMFLFYDTLLTVLVDFSAEISQKPIINGGSGTEEHPTQAIQDLFTIKREKKEY